MANTKMIVDELHKAFSYFNEALFNSELPEPAILPQNRGNKKRVLGWCSTKEIWINKNYSEKKYEINLVAESLNRPLYELMSTLLHEMVHLHNLINNIKDTSRNGTYHNKMFKEIAENHGLIVEHDKSIGWSPSKLSEETKALVDSFGLNEDAFSLYRIDKFTIGEGDESQEGDLDEQPRKRKSTRKYVCPGCGAIVRTTKDLDIICKTCREDFIKEE